LTNPTTAQPTFVADTAGDYVVQLIVNDGQVNSTPDNVLISAGSVSPPPAALPDPATLRAPGADSNSNCFIATAAYGSPLAPEVQALRDLRDRYLLPHPLGRWAVAGYYRVSPPLADAIRASEPLRALTRAALGPVVAWAGLTVGSPAVGGSLALVPLGVALWWVGRRHRRV